MAEKLQFDLLLEDKRFIAAMKKAEEEVNALNENLKTAAGGFSTFKGVLGAEAVVKGLSLVSNALVGLGKTATSAFTSAVKGAANLETISTQFEVLIGNAEGANELLKDLKKFSADTPFQINGLADASKKLLGFGFAQDEVLDRLREIGDVSAASGADINELSLIYGQVAAAGKLTGERLLQLQERAIPIGPAIAKTMGVGVNAVKDLVSQGEVTTEVFQKAFATISQEGGPAFQGMTKRAETLEGVLSTLEDNFNLFTAELGKEFLPLIKEVSKEMIKFIQTLNIKQLRKFAQQGVELVRGALKSIPDVINDQVIPAFKTLMSFMDDVGKGFKVLKSIVSKGGFNDLNTSIDETSERITKLGQLFKKLVDDGIEDVQIDAALFVGIKKAMKEGISKGAIEGLDIQTLNRLKSVAKKALLDGVSTGTKEGLDKAKIADNFLKLLKPAEVSVIKTMAESVSEGVVKGIESGTKKSNFRIDTNVPVGGPIRDTSRIDPNAPVGGPIRDTSRIDPNVPSAGPLSINSIISDQKIKDLDKALDAQDTKAARDSFDKAVTANETAQANAQAELGGLTSELGGLTAQLGAEALNATVKGGKEGAKALVKGTTVGLATAFGGPVAGQIAGPLVDLLLQDPEDIKAGIDSLVEQLPVVIEALAEAMPIVAEALAENADLIILAIVRSIPTIISALNRALIIFIRELGQDFLALLETSFQDLTRGLTDGIKNFGPAFVQEAKDAGAAFLEKLKELSEKIFQPIQPLIDAINELIKILKGGAGYLGGKISQGFKNTIKGDINPSKILGLATGGFVEGSGNRDTVPARLSPGELVVDRTTGPRLREFLNNPSAFATQQQGGSQISDALLSQILQVLQKPQTVSTQLTINDQVLAEAILELIRNDARLLA